MKVKKKTLKLQEKKISKELVNRGANVLLEYFLSDTSHFYKRKI